MCGTTGSEAESIETDANPIVPADTVRALIVFAKFPDGRGVYYDSSATYGWPDPDTVPEWAGTLIDHPDSSLTEGSISHFFWEMSDSLHLVQGGVFPDVVTTISTIWDLNDQYSTEGSRINAAGKEVMAQVVSALGPTVHDYDYDGDGFFDQMWIYYRSIEEDSLGLRLFDANGFAQIVGADTTFHYDGPDSGSISFGGEAGTSNSPYLLHLGGQYFDLLDRWQVFNILCHEYGHHVGVGGHPQSLGPFSMMAYRPVAIHPAHVIASGAARQRIGWIAPDSIDCSGSSVIDTTLVLKAAETENSEAFAVIQTVDSLQTFLLECRVADASLYTRDKENGNLDIDEGHSGLLITHIGGKWESWADTTGQAPRYDPELASGMYDSTGAPDPVHGQDEKQANQGFPPEDTTWNTYEWDLLQNGPSGTPWTDLFGPYTNPSSNLYRADSGWCGACVPPRPTTIISSDQTIYSGITVYNVEWTDGDHDSMYVSIHYDGNGGVAPAKADTIRTDTTWSGRVQLTGDLYVDPGATLTMNGNAEVIAATTDRFAGGLDTARIEVIAPGNLFVEGASLDPV
ncbi:hypothetical protein K8I85_05765, partial [bacterium]|nr:hypothetical protein [bacterium]